MNKFTKFPAIAVAEFHPLFKGLLWVAAARSTDETRYVLCHVHIEKDGAVWKLVATDGRRMHIHEFDPGLFEDDIDLIPEGLYEVVAKTSKVIVIAESDCGSTYPNWRGIVPDYEANRSVSITPQTISRLGIMTGVLLAADFTVDAIGFGHGRKKDATANIEFAACPAGDGAFVITHDIGKAILMPIRMNEDDQSEAKTDAENTAFIPGMEPEKEDEEDENAPVLDGLETAKGKRKNPTK